MNFHIIVCFTGFTDASDDAPSQKISKETSHVPSRLAKKGR